MSKITGTGIKSVAVGVTIRIPGGYWRYWPGTSTTINKQYVIIDREIREFLFISYREVSAFPVLVRHLARSCSLTIAVEVNMRRKSSCHSSFPNTIQCSRSFMVNHGALPGNHSSSSAALFHYSAIMVICAQRVPSTTCLRSVLFLP